MEHLSQKLTPLDDLTGYFIIEGGLIHYFDKNKNYQRTKILIQ
jgi:hypothetical protein